MAQTGQSLYRYLQQKVGQAYSGYLDTFKGDRIFKEALIKSIETKHYDREEQKTKDDLSFVTKTNRVFVPNNNKLNTQALQVSNVVVVNPTTFAITTFLPHNLLALQTATISGVQGTLTMPSANGNHIATTIVDQYTFLITVASATGVYVANTGTVIGPDTISDYWHLLSIKAKFSEPLYQWKVTGATNTTPIVVTINTYNSFRTGDRISIAGVLGNVAANGIFYIRKINNFKIALYSDQDLQVPVIGNGDYVSGGTLAKVFYFYCASYTSEQKVSVINVGDAEHPYVEVADNLLRIYPLNLTCEEVTIDYINIPQKLIVTTDNTVDLTLYYPEKFLFYVIDTAAQLFAAQVRDTELFQEQGAEKAQNK